MNRYLKCLAIDPSNTQTLYAGTGGGGAFKSTNGGAGWISSSTGLADSNVQCLTIDLSGILYAGTSGRLFRLAP